MAEDIEVDKTGITIHWKLIGMWVFRILEIIFFLVLTFHVHATHSAFEENALDQQKQNKRMERIERAIDACLTRQLECEARSGEQNRQELQ